MADLPNASEFEQRFTEVKIELGERAAEDSDFRAALLANPIATIEEEYGLPAGTLADLKVNVVEEPLGEVIIPIPADMSDAELSDEQLEAVAGGFAFSAAVTSAAVAGAAVGVSAVSVGATVAQGTRAGRRW